MGFNVELETKYRSLGLGGVRMSHLLVSVMNRLNQTESAIFNLPKDFLFRLV